MWTPLERIISRTGDTGIVSGTTGAVRMSERSTGKARSSWPMVMRSLACTKPRTSSRSSPYNGILECPVDTTVFSTSPAVLAAGSAIRSGRGTMTSDTCVSWKRRAEVSRRDELASMTPPAPIVLTRLAMSSAEWVTSTLWLVLTPKRRRTAPAAHDRARMMGRRIVTYARNGAASNSAAFSGAAMVAFLGAISPNTLWTNETMRSAVTRARPAIAPWGRPMSS